MGHTDNFAWTQALVNLSNQLWAVTAMVGAALCGVVLIGIGIIAMNPVSRPHFDRVSFRILVFTLAANTVFGVTNAIGGKFTGPKWTCGLDIWLLQLTLELSSFLLFSIALNLQLVVVHRINGQRMEKWYIWGSIILALALTVPPYALKQYGWDPLVEDCWYSNDDPKQRLGWQIGTQLFWSLLAVAGEIVCTTTVLVFMFRHQLQKKQIMAGGTVFRMGTGSATRSRSDSMVAAAVNNQVAHANTYRGIILRIVAYPVASALFNLISIVCVIHATQDDGVRTWVDYCILLLSDFVYGGRSILYALLATTDPALIRAAKAFVRHSRGLHPSSISGAQSKGNISVHLELSTIQQNDKGTITDGNGVPTKPAASTIGSPHGYSDHFDSMPKPLFDLGEPPLDYANQSAPDFHELERGRIRVQEDRVRRQKELEKLDDERQAFQRQI